MQAEPQAQGDILFWPVESIPEGARSVARENGRLIVAIGEATGHHHAVIDANAEMLEVAGTAEAVDRFLRSAAPIVVTHEEHGALALAPGIYEVIRQVEEDDEEVWRVED